MCNGEHGFKWYSLMSGTQIGLAPKKLYKLVGMYMITLRWVFYNGYGGVFFFFVIKLALFVRSISGAMIN